MLTTSAYIALSFLPLIPCLAPVIGGIARRAAQAAINVSAMITRA